MRLPADGKVPIFRAGSLCVVGHTKTSSQLVVSNNQTINLARVRLSRVVVRDANGIDTRRASRWTWSGTVPSPMSRP